MKFVFCVCVCVCVCVLFVCLFVVFLFVVFVFFPCSSFFPQNVEDKCQLGWLARGVRIAQFSLATANGNTPEMGLLMACVLPCNFKTKPI